MSGLVYVDTETTGLDPAKHHVWEMAFAVEDRPIRSAFVPHVLVGATDEALKVGRYYERCVRADINVWFDEDAETALTDATMVAANPAFDAAFLSARWGFAPWKFRLLDIEAFAMGALGFDEPRGLATIARTLRDEHGFEIPEPDHTAAGDVATLRASHLALKELYR